jgi:hypothetical protein
MIAGVPRLVTSLGLLALLAAVGGCRTHPVAEPDRHTTPQATPPKVVPPRDRPAFLVQTRHATVVVPIDASVAIGRVPGIWTAVGNDLYGRLETAVGLSTDPDTAALPICADASPYDGCRMGSDHDRVTVTIDIDALAGQPPAWTIADSRDRPCTCVVVEGVSTDITPVQLDPDLLAEAERLGWSPEEFAALCLEEELPDLVPTTVMGGVLYRTGMGHSGTCEGLNIYDGAGDAIALRPGAVEMRREMPPPRECVESFGELSVNWIGVAEPDCMLGEPDCNCRGTTEMEAWLLHRGNLVHAVGDLEAVGGGCSCTSRTPIAAASCPSPTDPCGETVGFTTIDPATDDFWIATYEDFALVLRKDRLLVMHRGDPKAIRDEPIPAPGLDVLGVEFHRNAALLDPPPEFPRTLRVPWPALAAEDRALTGDASAWGDRCVVHLRAKRLDEAEAACFAALEAGGTNKTRGAITYNLGRTAEARSDPFTALRWYRRSDRLRPGNATVKARIDALASAQ